MSAEKECADDSDLWRAFEEAVTGAMELAGAVANDHASKCKVLFFITKSFVENHVSTFRTVRFLFLTHSRKIKFKLSERFGP